MQPVHKDHSAIVFDKVEMLLDNPHVWLCCSYRSDDSYKLLHEA